MPIEVKELIIKATVQDAAAQTGAGAAPREDREAIIQACVEKVLEILREKKER